MNDWEKYSNLNMENITGSRYSHAKRIWKHFETQKLSEYNDLYLKSETLLLFNVFLKTSKNVLRNLQIWSSKISFSHQISLESSFKNDQSKIRIISWYWHVIRDGLCHFINRYPIANNNYMKDYGKAKESSPLKYWKVKNLCGWAMLLEFLVNGFTWVKDNSVS